LNPIRPIVYVVDDDHTVRASIAFLLGVIEVDVRPMTGAREFIAGYQPGIPGCLVLDVRMPGMSGLELQDRLLEYQIDIPVIFISGHGEIPMVVRTMRKGAVDFLQKPFNDQELLDRVQQSIEADRVRHLQRREEITAVARHELLTPREKDTMQLILKGMTNREMAETLGISPKTIETHRARVMEKMQANSLAGLVALWQIVDRASRRHRGQQ
jgi:RNA polymerase sigma factor (sigma-70 family)